VFFNFPYTSFCPQILFLHRSLNGKEKAEPVVYALAETSRDFFSVFSFATKCHGNATFFHGNVRFFSPSLYWLADSMWAPLDGQSPAYIVLRLLLVRDAVDFAYAVAFA
jgi:hypothetical protein